nr:collagen-binding domain-containing protein [Streptomyces coryli]
MAGNNGFPVVVEQDALLGSTEMEGPAAIGGDLRFGAGYNVAIHTPGSYVAPGDDAPTALLVGGGVDFPGSDPSGVLRVTDGQVKIGDTSGAQALNRDANNAAVNTRVVADGAGYDSVPRIELTNSQAPGSVGPQPGLMDFGSLFATYRERAQEIAGCPQNVDLNGGRISLEDGRTNVLHVTGEQLNDLDELTFLDRPTSSGPLVIVVDTTATGGTHEWDIPNMAGVSGEDAPYILWDFPDASDITITSGDSLEGTIYAPGAHLTDLDPANIEGDIAVQSLTAGPIDGTAGGPANAGEIHYFPFDAELDCDAKPGPRPPLPDFSLPRGDLDIRKTDATTGRPLAGAEFELWRETNRTDGLQTGGADPDRYLAPDCVTDSRGRCSFTSKLIGTYYLRETAVPDGYRLPRDPVSGPYSITRDNAEQGVTVELSNRRLPQPNPPGPPPPDKD